MAKRKNTRMFSREQRRQARAEQLERAKGVTQEDLDRATIAQSMIDGTSAETPLSIAETWLGARDECGAEGDRELAGALERQYRRLTGRELNADEAGELLDADFERRNELFEASLDEPPG